MQVKINTLCLQRQCSVDFCHGVERGNETPCLALAVSLAAALSITLFIREGQAFPYRNLILFITFIVILVTLVFQGLTLPWLVRKAKPGDNTTNIPEQKQEIFIQKKIANGSLLFLEEKYGEDRTLKNT